MHRRTEEHAKRYAVAIATVASAFVAIASVAIASVAIAAIATTAVIAIAIAIASATTPNAIISVMRRAVARRMTGLRVIEQRHQPVKMVVMITQQIIDKGNALEIITHFKLIGHANTAVHLHRTFTNKTAILGHQHFRR